MKKLFLVILPLFFIWSAPGIAQEEDETFQVHGKDTVYPLKDGRFMVREKIYKKNSPYMTMAYGAGMNMGKKTIEHNLLISYHHFINKIGVGIGYHTSSDIKVWWRSYQKQNDLFLAGGGRHEGL